MAKNLPYLTVSKTGWFEYRRRIPDKLRASFGNRREFKKALRTTILKEAVARWQIANNEYEAAAERFYRLQTSPSSALTEDVVAQAKAKLRGLEPPTLRAGATAAERLAFEADEEAWLAAVENWEDELRDRYIDEKQRQEDYDKGLWGEPGYQEPYLPVRQNDPDVLAYKYAREGLPIELKPTWRDAIENYLRINSSDKARDPGKQAAYEKKMRKLLNDFGLSLGRQGSSTPLDLITRQQARAFKDQFGISTGNRYNNVLSAVINAWNREVPGKVVSNPFSGLSQKLLEVRHGTKRRSFSPDQWRDYVQALVKHRNSEIGLIGLIMAYTGCRTSEAAGLAVKDIRLDAKVPNIVFRSNEVRSLDKGGLERAVPIFDPLLAHLKAYKENRGTTADTEAFFVRYGDARHYSNVSQQLNSILRDKLKISDKSLVAYSFRHTVHDKGRAARIDTAIHEYIVGHRSTGSSRIHQSYGTRTPPEALVEDMKAILSQATWDSDFD